MNPIVLHQKGNLSSFAAAYAARQQYGDECIYLAATPGVDFIELDQLFAGFKGRVVNLIDFAFPEEHMKFLRTRAAKLNIFTSTEEMSSALAAWQYFLPNRPVPMLIQCIDDQVTERRQIHNSDAVCAALGQPNEWTSPLLTKILSYKTEGPEYMAWDKHWVDLINKGKLALDAAQSAENMKAAGGAKPPRP